MTHNQDLETVAELKSRLDRRNIPYQPLKDGLRVASASEAGFDTSIRFDRDRCYVELGGWHEEFENQRYALNCFVAALSSACRLAVTKRGFDHKWTVQSRRGDSWQDDSTTGLL